MKNTQKKSVFSFKGKMIEDKAEEIRKLKIKNHF